MVKSDLRWYVRCILFANVIGQLGKGEATALTIVQSRLLFYKQISVLIIVCQLEIRNQATRHSNMNLWYTSYKRKTEGSHTFTI